MPGISKKTVKILRVNVTPGRIFITVTLLLLIGLFLDYTGTLNIVSKSKIPSDDKTDNINVDNKDGINYGTPRQEDNFTVPEKSSSSGSEPSQNISSAKPISVLITSTRKSGNYYLIKVVISGSNNASCSATMTRGGLVVIATSSTENVEGQYSCKDLKIPMSQFLENGDWKLVVTVKDAGGASASDAQDVTI